MALNKILPWTTDLNTRPLQGAVQLTDTISIAFTRDYDNGYLLHWRQFGVESVAPEPGFIIPDADTGLPSGMAAYETFVPVAQSAANNEHHVMLTIGWYDYTVSSYAPWQLTILRFAIDSNDVVSYLGPLHVGNLTPIGEYQWLLIPAGDGVYFSYNSFTTSTPPAFGRVTYDTVHGWQIEPPMYFTTAQLRAFFPVSGYPADHTADSYTDFRVEQTNAIWVGGDRILALGYVNYYSGPNLTDYPYGPASVNFECFYTARRTGVSSWVLEHKSDNLTNSWGL